MNKTFKLSTFVIKLMFFAFVMASFALSSVRAAEKSENEKMVMGTVRLSLWYQGINEQNQEKPAVKESLKNAFGVEELDRAMIRYSKSQQSFDAKR